MIAVNRWMGSYDTLVNRYIALTKFSAQRLVAGGLPKNRIEIKSNFLPNVPPIGKGEGGYAVYTGRLSKEKGIETLITAWKQLPQFPLKIIGEGPIRKQLENISKREGLPIEFLGFLNRESIMEIVGKAEIQIVPSEWYEGFPMVILEAYACGTPVVASRIGGLDEIVLEGKTGTKFEPKNPINLAENIKNLLENRNLLLSMRHNVRAHFDLYYNEETNFTELMGIYDRAIVDCKKAM